MDKKYFSLELHRNNRLTRIFQVAFGIICAGVAIVWLIINPASQKMNLSLLITILFLLGFAWFQIMSGLGRAEKFIEFSQNKIRLKRNSVLPVKVINSVDILKIEIDPISVIFFMKTGNKVILRFGTTFTDIIGPVKDAIESFCLKNKINCEFREEEF